MSTLKNKSKSELIEEIESFKKRIKESERIKDIPQVSEKRYHCIFEHSGEGIFLINPKGYFLDVNQKICQMFGYTQQEFLQFHVNNLHPPDIVKSAWRIFEQIEEEGQGSFEIDCLKKSGEVFSVEISASTLKIGDENLMQGVIRDITELKRSEMALHESESRFRKIFEEGLVGIAIAGADYHFINANPLFCKMFGYSEQELRSLSFKDITHPDFIESSLEDAENLFEGKPSKKREKIYIKKNKEQLWGEVAVTAIKDEKGNFLYYLAMVEDISERKKAQLSLEESEKKFLDLYDNAPDMFVSVDAKTRKIRECNQTIIDKLGYSRQEILGSPIFKLYHADSLEGAKRMFKKFVETGEVRDAELQLKRKDGSKINASLNVSAVRDKEGAILYSRSVWRDITERKRDEEKLRKSEKQLKEAQRIAHLGSWEWNIVQNTTVWSDELYRIFGVKADQFDPNAYETFLNCIHPGDRERVGRVVDESINEKSPFEIEYRIVRPDETVRQIHAHGEIICNKIGSPVTMIGSSQDITESKLVVEALHKSEEKFRRLAENAPDIIYCFRVSPDPGFEFVSPAVTKITGYTPQEFYDDPGFGQNIVHPDDRDKLNGLYKGIIPETPHQVRWIRKDGKIIWTEDRLSPIYNDKGELIVIEGIAREITAQKEAEKALTEAYDIINKSPAIPFLWKNEEGWPIEYVSVNVVDLFEYSAEEFISGKVNYSKLIYPEDLERIENEVTRYSSEKGRDRFSHEPFRIVTKSGKIKWVENKTYIRRDHKNNITHYQGIVEDITARRLSELAGMESEERFSKTFNSSPNPMIISEIESGKIVDVNKTFEKLIKYSKQELINKNIFELNLWKNIEDRENYVRKMKEDKSVSNLEIKIRTKPGDIRDSLISGEILTIQGKPYLLTSGIDITERKLAEEALKEQLNWNQQILETTLDGYLLADSDGKIIDVNPAYCDMIGYTWEELLEMNIREVEVKTPPEEVDRRIQQMIRRGGDHFETKHKHKDGHILELDTSTNITYLDEAPRVAAFMRDITERKKIEEALRESELKFREMADLLPQIVYETDLNAILTFSNKQSSFILGYSEAELLNNFDVLNNIVPEDRDRAKENMKIIMTGKPVENSEYSLIKKDGSTFPVLIYSSPVIKYNKPVGLRGIVVDISDRKRAEELIQESERRLATLMSNLPGMAYKCKNDPDWTMEFISDGCYSLTGYYSEELVDNSKVSYADLIHPEDRQIVWDKVQDAIEMNQPFQLNYRITNASGAEKWVWEQGQAIYGDENNVISLEGFITDITERKKADKKLRDSHNQLRSLAERLQIIREEERAIVAREIHDDLGQTLTALKMDIAWMKKNSGMKDEMRVSKLDGILGLTDSTIQTVKRIATDLRPGILDDLGLVSAIEWQTKEFQNRSGIECNFEVFVDEFTVEDDISIAVFRIFQESLTNIARHSQATKITVTIRRADDFFLVEISDNGVGINEEQINSSKSLGLLGMNERVTVFRGKLTISRAAEGGTTVRVYIPIGKA